MKRSEDKLREQASAINANYQVIDLNNTVEPREFGKIIDTDIEIKGLVNCIGSILIKPLHGTSIDEFKASIDKTNPIHNRSIQLSKIDILK